MAHGFLAYEPVSGDNFWKNLKDVYKGLKDLAKLYDTGNKILKANVRELDPKQLAAGKPAALPSGAPKALAAAPATKMLGAGSGSIVGKNPTNIDVKTGERPESGPRLPGGVGGGGPSKGGGFTDIPGIASAGLNTQNFFSKAVNEGIDVNTGQYLSKEARIAAFKAGKVDRNASQGPSISPDSGVDIVAAVNRNTQMIVSLVDAVKTQTQNDSKLTEQQIQTQETLMLRAAASQKESALEQGGDYSGFMTPENFQKKKKQEEKKETGSKLKEFFRGPNPFQKDEGCGCSPFMPGPGGGGGILGGPIGGGGGLPIPDYVDEWRSMNRRPGSRLGGGASVTRRGGAARRTTRLATKVGGKGAGKAVAKGVGKGLMKKIPVLGALAGGAFAAERAMSGDWLGAGGELLSGIASIIPGIGTAVSTGIDAGLMARDAGLTPFATGGIVTQPTTGLVGEAGNEGVFPLEGTRGRKTFQMFGEGIFAAQKNNESDYAKLQAKGFKQYFETEGGGKKLGETLKDFFKGLGGVFASLFGGPAKAATGPGGPGSGDYVGDPTITGDEKEYLLRLMIAEAGGQGDIGMAAVGRSVLNRAGLIQSGAVGAGTFNAKSGSLMDVINASGQYQPVAQGKLKRELSADERKRAEAALAIAMNQADMRGRLEAKGLTADNINKLMAATGFRAGSAFNDPSQNVNVTKLGDHYFNTAGNKDLKVAGQVRMHSPAPHASGPGNAIFGETGRVFNRAGYVHGHFQTDTGSKADVVNDVAPMIRSLLNSGVTDVSITSGETFRKDMNDAQIRALIEKGISKHTHSGGGKAVDIFVPKGTKVPFPLSDVRRTKGNENGGITGILPGSGKVWVGHLDPRSKSGGTKPKPSSEMANQPGQTSPAKPSPRASTRVSPGSLQASAANANDGTPMMAASQQIAMGSLTTQGGSPTIINNYYTGGGMQGGVNGNGVSPGIGMDGTGTSVFQELKIRALA